MVFPVRAIRRRTGCKVKVRHDFNYRNYILLIWILVLINLFVISRWLARISLSLAIIVFTVGFTVTILLTVLSQPRSRTTIPEWVLPTVKKAMTEFQPVAEEILNYLVTEKTNPLVETARSDLAKNTGWLCESGRRFGQQVLNGLNEIKKKLFWSPGVSLSGELFQLQKSVEERVVVVTDFLDSLDVFVARVSDELELAISRNLKETWSKLRSQHQIALRYLEELLYAQIEEWGAEEGDKPVPQMERIGGQYEVLIQPSVNRASEHLQARLFSVVQELSSKVVGRLQRETLAQVNSLEQLAAQVERLLTHPRAPREKLGGALELLYQMKQEISDVMMTLAWQDLILEERWRESKQRLTGEAEQLASSLTGDEHADIWGRLEQIIDGWAKTKLQREAPGVISLLTAAEKNYWDFEKGLLSKEHMATNILQWAAAAEYTASTLVAVSSEVLSYRRLIRDEVRDGKHDAVFEKARGAVLAEIPELEKDMRGLYPNGFYAFCLNPGVGYQPHSAADAAWMLYLRLLFEGKDPEEEPDTCLLIGLLLGLHVIRNRYVQVTDVGLISDVNDWDDLENMRLASLKIVELLNRDTG